MISIHGCNNAKTTNEGLCVGRLNQWLCLELETVCIQERKESTVGRSWHRVVLNFVDLVGTG